MKMRRIPEIDLARIATMPDYQQQYFALKRLKGFKPPHTLNPFRKVIGDIVNLQFDLLGGKESTPWIVIRELIARASTKGDTAELRFNLAIARTVFEYCEQKSVESFSKPVLPWGVGYGNSVTYWNNFYSIIDEQACFVFFDPRLTGHLNADARRFVFSMMHERLRVADPDFQDARLLITQFKKTGKWSRHMAMHDAADCKLFSENQLNEMISVTYAIWAEVLAEREQAARRASGGTNPMGF